MLILTITPDEFTTFVMGIVAGASLVVGLLLWENHLEQKRKERTEFEAWKKQRGGKAPEVVDAQFVTAKPRPTSSPQLPGSTAMVTRTSVARRDQ